MQESLETWVQSLGWEDPLEESMTIHCSTLAWKIPWTEEPSRQEPIQVTELDTTKEQQKHHDYKQVYVSNSYFIKKGNL